MPRIVITHSVKDVKLWASKGDERAEIFAPFATEVSALTASFLRRSRCVIPSWAARALAERRERHLADAGPDVACVTGVPGTIGPMQQKGGRTFGRKSHLYPEH